jgi:hypothetical protein
VLSFLYNSKGLVLEAQELFKQLKQSGRKREGEEGNILVNKSASRKKVKVPAEQIN